MYIIIASERINEIPTIGEEVLILAKEDSMLPARCFCNNYQIECFPETQFSAIAIAFRLGTKIKEGMEEPITILCGSDEILEGLRQLPFKEQLKLEKLAIQEEEVENTVNKHEESAVSNPVEKKEEKEEEKEDTFPMNQPQDQPEEQTQESIPVPSTTAFNKKERKKKEPVKKETKKNQSISHLKAKGNLLTPGTIKMK